MRSRRKGGIPAVATVALIGALQLGAPAPAAATGKEAGRAVVTKPFPDGGGELQAAVSTTRFTLRLPSGAACKGDSANDGWRVQSFIVPASVNPGTLQFASNGPVGDGLHALYDDHTASWTNQLTAERSAPGQPGPIAHIATFSFGVFPRDVLRPGSHQIGLACTLGPVAPDQLDRYWAATIRITADDRDPAGFRWTPATTGDQSRPEPSRWLLIGGVMTTIAAAGALLQRRSRQGLAGARRQMA